MRKTARQLLGSATAILVIALLAVPQPAESEFESSKAFLYQVALKDRDDGHLEDAIHELHKVLLIDPHDDMARQELKRLESLLHKRGQAMEAALESISHPSATDVPAAPGTSRIASEQPSVPSVPERLPGQDQWVRVPDPAVNHVEWLYVFGRQGDAKYGSLLAPNEV